MGGAGGGGVCSLGVFAGDEFFFFSFFFDLIDEFKFDIGGVFVV
jgi:hypothetical protein